MITQYTGSYGSISSDVQSLIANKVSMLDRYILMQTGDGVYTALVYNPATRDCRQFQVTRGQYNSGYQVVETVGSFDYSVSNEYYVYSNVGYGRALDLPVYDGVISWSLVFIAVLLAFAVVFKGALFKCLKRG